jgi:fumarate reductase subunit C
MEVRLGGRQVPRVKMVNIAGRTVPAATVVRVGGRRIPPGMVIASQYAGLLVVSAFIVWLVLR